MWWLILELLGLYRRPSALKTFKARRIDMNVQLDWTFGPVSGKQKPIAKTRIEARVNAANAPWSVIAEPAAPALQLIVQDVAPGDWQYRATPVDTAGVAGPTFAPVSLSVPFDSPSALASFTAKVV